MIIKNTVSPHMFGMLMLAGTCGRRGVVEFVSTQSPLEFIRKL